MDDLDIVPAGTMDAEYDLYAEGGEYVLPAPPPYHEVPEHVGRYRASGAPAAFRRVTALAGALSDQERLTEWRGEKIVEGLAGRMDLLLAAEGASRWALRDIAEKAANAAGANTGRNEGTGLHVHATAIDDRLTSVNSDSPMGEIEEYLRRRVPPDYRDDLRAYAALMLREGIYLVGRPEVLVVHPDMSAAGRYDKMGYVGGAKEMHILDIKTSQHRPGKYDQLQIGMQLALYAYAPLELYDVSPELEWRRRPPALSRDTAYVIWLPARCGKAELIRFNIADSWPWVQLALQVLTARRCRGLYRKVGQASSMDLPGPELSIPNPGATVTLANPPGTVHEDPVLARLTEGGKALYHAIRAVTDPATIGGIYDEAMSAGTWDPALNAVAQERWEELQEACTDGA